MANDLLNRMDLTFPFRVCDHGGGLGGAVARAYLIAVQIIEVRPLWTQIEELGSASCAGHPERIGST